MPRRHYRSGPPWRETVHHEIRIKKLEDAYAAGYEAQKALLKSLKQEKELWTKRNLDGLSVTEVGRWLRNRYLDDRAKHPTAESGEEVLKKIRGLFDGVTTEGNEEAPKLIEGAELFVRRKLSAKAP